MCIKLEEVLAEAERRNTSDVSDLCKNVEASIRVLVVMIPFILICASVFVIFACLWDRQGLRGWTVMGMTGTYALRVSARATRDLSIYLAGWNIIVDAPSFCFFLGMPIQNETVPPSSSCLFYTCRFVPSLLLPQR